jgi:hypothetical protein
MKTRHILLIIGLAVGSHCFGQQKLFDKFASKEGVSSVYISKAMFDMIPSLGDVNDVNLSKLKKIEGLNILSSEQASVVGEMRKAFRELITDRHEELMRIRGKNEDVTFYARKNGSDIEELIMLVDEAEKFAVIQILGHFTIRDIQEFAREK